MPQNSVLLPFLIAIVLIIGKSCSQSDGKHGIFESSHFWTIDSKPVMANGHIGIVPYGDSVYMNGLYNGHEGHSHRACIPNYGNIQFDPCTRNASKINEICYYALDIYNGVFRTNVQLDAGNFTVEQIQYVHRYHETAIVNHIRLKRNKQTCQQVNVPLRVRLFQTVDFNSDDLELKSSKSFEILNKPVVLIEASTKLVEHPLYQPQHSTVSILYEQIPATIELPTQQTEIEYIFIAIIQRDSTDIEEKFREIHANPQNLLQSHTNEWHKFWSEKRISVEGNENLSNSLDASLFALASALPSLNTSHSRAQYYGLSPAGLGLDRTTEVYMGHSFWDTEVWMHPTILLLQPQWSEQLLNYRHLMRGAAHDNALKTGYTGYRFPWESAFTGIDVTQPGYPEIVKFQQHITADIGYALRQHFFATHHFQWFQAIGCDLAYGTGEFWASRVKWNATTHRYDINGIMGPDEDHSNINNNAYTNVAAALNLHFGAYASCICNKLNPSKYPNKSNWSTIAKHVTLLYDRRFDYNPQYDGYNLSIPIKQADVTLLGYPLHYSNIRTSTRQNNLKFYANLTRSNGPAMTWSMHAIGHLDVDTMPPTDDMFNRTFVPYIRLPYYVWNEYVNGVNGGAGNFITGAGGFLQLIMYGYAGIRINADSLTIRRSQLPPNTKTLKLKGISYMQALCDIQLTKDNVRINIMKNRDLLHVFIDDMQQDSSQDLFELNRMQTLKLKPKPNEYVENCPLPEDTVDELDIN